ncbi:MAG: CPBP family intramembrane metalloprotease [Candidatus Latescibacteria bacterium]|nr:CPBP family intramembrane metalloprotease [Candidatus Latescibacterota bacterium]
MKPRSVTRPLLFVVLVSVIFMLCHLLWRWWLPDAAEETRSLLEKATSCLFALALTWWLGWWREAGLTVAPQPRTWLVFLPLAVIPALMLVFSEFGPATAGRLLFLAAVALMTGFAEEVVFRGVAVHALLPGGVLRAALLSSVIFGLLHLANLAAGAEPVATGLQVVFAGLFGFAAAAPRLVTGTLWPLVAIHALQDFLAFWSAGGLAEKATLKAGEVVAPLVIMMPITGFGLWLLRRSARAGGEERAG